MDHIRPAIVGLVVAFFIIQAGKDVRAEEQPKDRKAVAAGVWGGKRLRMEVTEAGASLSFDCATGEITEPLLLDANGQFRAAGRYKSEAPGPQREGSERASPAVFSGSVEGDTMKIEVSVPDEKVATAYVLVRGRQGRIVPCK